MQDKLDLRRLAERLLVDVLGRPVNRNAAVDALVTALRIVWNERGAVDIATVERELSTMMGSAAAGPYCKNLDRALRALDHHTH